MSDIHLDHQPEQDTGDWLPRDIRGALTPSQLVRLAALLAKPSSNHAIQYQVSTSLFGRNFYFALFSGSEGRSPERLTREGQHRSFLGLVFKAGLVFWLLSGVLVLLAIALYLLKSTAGVDLFEEHSFLHQLFYE